jgi:hypothetical protein
VDPLTCITEVQTFSQKRSPPDTQPSAHLANSGRGGRNEPNGTQPAETGRILGFVSDDPVSVAGTPSDAYLVKLGEVECRVSELEWSALDDPHANHPLVDASKLFGRSTGQIAAALAGARHSGRQTRTARPLSTRRIDGSEGFRALAQPCFARTSRDQIRRWSMPVSFAR